MSKSGVKHRITIPYPLGKPGALMGWDCGWCGTRVLGRLDEHGQIPHDRDRGYSCTRECHAMIGHFRRGKPQQAPRASCLE